MPRVRRGRADVPGFDSGAGKGTARGLRRERASGDELSGCGRVNDSLVGCCLIEALLSCFSVIALGVLGLVALAFGVGGGPILGFFAR